MKKYNMPTMEISLFDVEVISTTGNDASTGLTAFENAYQTASNGGVAKTIQWNELSTIW